MKKILIYRRESDLAPTGGPKGYLYNLRDGLKQVDNKDLSISFLPPDSRGVIADNRTRIKKKLPGYIVRTIKSMQHGKVVYDIVHKVSTPIVDINSYDLIHFQDTCSMYPLRKQLEHYTGTIALTSHSPQPLYQEFIENASRIEKILLKKTYSELHLMDEYAFNRADYIIFPTPFSDEPYINRWEMYKDFKNTNKDKFRYILSGTTKPVIRQSRTEIRHKYNIPDDAFVISYIGRHSAIKGYNHLIKYCEKYCSGNTYVLVAGNQGETKAPQNTNWIEIGWTNDPYSVMNASDVFVLPNQETYFDLVLLEVLSIGTIALVSNTGGNKYFDSEEYPGVIIYRDESDFDNKLSYIMNMDIKEKTIINENNRNIYDSQFTTQAFASGYVRLINSIIE